MGRKRRERDRMPAPAATTAAILPAIRHTLSGGTLTHGSVYGTPSAGQALAIDTVYACVRLIADAIAGASWGEWRGPVELEPSRLVRRPAATMTRREWTWLVTATLALYNTAVLEIVGRDSEGVPVSLLPVSPARVGWPSGVLYVDGSPADASGYYVMRRAVLPTQTPQLASILSLAREYLAAAGAASLYQTEWWTAGGAPVTVLTTDQVLNDDDAALYADRWMERRALGPSVPAILGKGLTAAQFGADLGTEAAAAASAEMAASVTRFFGVPPHLVAAERSGGSSLTYTNVETEGLHFSRYTAGAYADTIGDTFSEFLPGDYITGRVVRLDLSHLTMPEMSDRFAAWSAAIAAGWMTVDEVRAREGLAPMAAGVASEDGAE